MHTDLDTKIVTKLKKPSNYSVVLFNDDFTPMDFVVTVLQDVFNHSMQHATTIMINVHEKGKGVCGTYSFEVAETKMLQVIEMAQKEEYPLQCGMEEV